MEKAKTLQEDTKEWKEVEMRVELGVNIDSVFTSYSYYAFPQCIITAKERIGSKIAQFTILGTPKNKWKEKGNIREKDNKNVWEVFSEDRYRRDCNGCLYRELEENDFIHIQVDYWQYTQAWGAVNLFISDDEENVLLGDQEYIFRFGQFIYDGISLYEKGRWQDIKKEKLKTPYQLVLCRREDKLEFYAGEGKAKLIKVCQKKLPRERKLFLGVQVKHEMNSVVPWFFSNFIQLSCDVNNLDRRLEYHYGLLKHWDSNVFHYFFDTDRMDSSMLIKLGGVRFVKTLIQKGKYLEISLDQYYIQERDEYRSFHHLHQNLIYGYDDKEKCLLIVGYDKLGKLRKMIIQYGDFLQTLKANDTGQVKIITYEEDGYPFLFDCSYVKEMIRQYLNGINSSMPFGHIVPKLNRTYGMDIYKELATDKGIQVLVADRRVAHVLWEHKRCMAERISYLTEVGALTKDTGIILRSRMDEIAEKVYDLKYILLKYQICTERIEVDRIRKLLCEICKLEGICLSEMLEKWQPVME